MVVKCVLLSAQRDIRFVYMAEGLCGNSWLSSRPGCWSAGQPFHCQAQEACPAVQHFTVGLGGSTSTGAHLT